MVELARQQPGFLGVDSIRGMTGRDHHFVLESEAAILAWQHPEHRVIQARGRAQWYSTLPDAGVPGGAEYRFG
jgi:heme-degrading monooxygenase HmoA